MAYEQVLPRVSFSLNHKYLDTINFKNCCFVLICSGIAYYCMSLFSIIFLLHLLGSSNSGFIFNLPSISFNLAKHILDGQPFHWNVNLHLQPLVVEGNVAVSGLVSEKIGITLTLSRNGLSNPSGPPAGQNSGSGSGAAGPRPRLPSFSELLASINNRSAPPTGIASEPAGSRVNLPSFADLLTSTNNAPDPATGTSSEPAESTSNLPTPAPRARAEKGLPARGATEVNFGESKTDVELDNKYGPNPNNYQLIGVRTKIMNQIRFNKSIYSNYPANQNPTGLGTTLTNQEQSMIARKLLGLRKGYSAHHSGTESNPKVKVMTQDIEGYTAVKANSALLNDLT